MAGKKMTDAIAIVDRRFFRSKRARAELDEARTGLAIARAISRLRRDAGLTQAELARLIGTSRPVISRLESDDYDGHSLSMLRRIAAAVGRRVEIRFVPRRSRNSAA